ncbi:YceI family protein [Flammeovirga sp. SubArs3]|uniref:YceI family protein n=1 Tax=Flammeovirga sp. SubArs3 TaxID=2995316 RepID=UPI00248BA487|nr:YceI family protein [Flammeovirga sp. SubArs3]
MKTSLLSFLLIFSLSTFSSLLAQTKNFSKENSSVKIEGTSSLHDWHCDVTEVTGSINANIDGNTISSIDALDLTFVVKSIKSGKGAMDKNIYSALKEKSNPQITFKMSSATISGNVVTAQGKLTIAESTQDVTLTANAAVDGDQVKFEGKTSFKMSQYSVEPPTAMFGTITTGDEVSIIYDVTFN